MSKHLLLLCLSLIFIFSNVSANENEMFQTVDKKQATLVKKDSSKGFCNVCGMHLTKFYKTNHVSEFKNGKKEQYCSMHCQSKIHKHHHDKIKTIQVVDTNSLQLINAKEAFYVIGSSKKGTMTPISKYAFLSKEEAQVFQKKFGGEIKSFKQTLEIAQDGQKDDLQMISKKRMKMARKGKKIFKSLCKKEPYPEFNSIGETKKYLIDNKSCKNIKGKKLQAVAIYLYNPILAQDKNKMIKVNENEKCPVCGMFVSKYPKWVATIKINTKDSHYFDGVKDMMKFYFNPNKYSHNHSKEDISKMLVTDYYSLNAINAKKAYYVIGSNIYGPMGEELIPFKSKKEANDFLEDHYGKKVLSFNEITESILY